MNLLKGRRGWVIGAFIGYAVLALAFSAAHNVGASQPALNGIGPAAFTAPTYSSPIAMSADNTLVWVVNPDDDSVSVIRTDTNAVIKKINVGEEPQSIAVDPNNTFAYVANAASNTITVIRITNPNPASFVAAVDATVGSGGELTTGAEPWNIVISPDGNRVFVSNSGQDTITVINANTRAIIGNVDLRNSICNDPDRTRHFQPRGMAVTLGNNKLLVTRFLSFTKSGGVQGDDVGKEGVVCRLSIDTASTSVAGYVPELAIRLASQDTGFTAQVGTPPVATATSAYPNQLQSVVINGTDAYLPNIAASPSRPLRFNVDTHAFVNRIDDVAGAGTDAGALNLHLGARTPETDKTKLFFANPWAIAFAGANAYAVSAGSDLLVKLNVDAGTGALSFTGGASTTTYIDLNNPDDPTTSGENAGKNPLGITINNAGTTAYVMNFVSRNVSVVNLAAGTVSTVLKTTELPPAGTLEETIHVGAEMFFSSRGNFVRPAGTTVSTQERLSSEGWQNCASCHFAGLTDGVVWQFGAGPRKSVPLNGTWNPHNPDDQRILNYSAIFDEVQDFELNIRNVSGPGNLAAPIGGSLLNPNQGLLISDTGNINFAPAVVNNFAKPNGGRPQHTVQLPGAGRGPVAALDALKEWVRFAIRTPNGALTTTELIAGGNNPAGGNGGISATDVSDGRKLFFQAGCQTCHGGGKWSNSTKDFTSPPTAAEIASETGVATTNQGTYLARFLRDIGSFALNVPSGGNLIPGTTAVGAVEKDTANLDALGKDVNGDGKGEGFNTPSLLGIHNVPPYYHNGACETLACVAANPVHRAKGLRPGQTDPLTSATNQAKLVRFLESLDAETAPATNLYIDRHDIFFDPPSVIAGTAGTEQLIGVNISLFGPKETFTTPLKVTFYDGKPGEPGTTVIGEADLASIDTDFGQQEVTVPWTVPNQVGFRRIFVTVDSTNLFVEANERDNTASRQVRVRPVPPDRTPPEVSNVQIENGAAVTSNSEDVDVSFNATDPTSPGGAQTSGLDAFCIVRYSFDSVRRRWVEEDCEFQALPDPVNGIFSVKTKLRPREGVAYAFVWVKDKAGNVSKTPGFDFISFVPASNVDIRLNRNDIRIFRITLGTGQTAQFTFDPDIGDIDVSAFANLANPVRCAVSANNGDQTETVTLGAGGCSGATSFQIEVRAVVNSRFRISFTQTLAGLLRATPSAISPSKVVSDVPIVLGPPAQQAAVDVPKEVFLPTSMR